MYKKDSSVLLCVPAMVTVWQTGRVVLKLLLTEIIYLFLMTFILIQISAI